MTGLRESVVGAVATLAVASSQGLVHPVVLLVMAALVALLLLADGRRSG